jgi:hypothetical protein
MITFNSQVLLPEAVHQLCMPQHLLLLLLHIQTSLQ